MKDFFEARRPHEGRTYDEYWAHWHDEVDQASTDAMGKKERKMHHYKTYNIARSEQVDDAYEPSAALREALAAIDAPQVWMVLTEPWCGDSAYNLPVIAAAAATADAVTLRVLPRDENLDIMDQYLTNGGRSIPKLVAFDAEGHELFTWGPRPAALQAYRQSLVEDDVDGKEVVRRLIERYEEGAWRDVDAELAERLRAVEAVAS